MGVVPGKKILPPRKYAGETKSTTTHSSCQQHHRQKDEAQLCHKYLSLVLSLMSANSIHGIAASAEYNPLHVHPETPPLRRLWEHSRCPERPFV